ncbi:MAG: 4-hydroxy-3-methylbut-2-enyl diphosphate reductase [Porphyromonadaceae bacterium]|nr:MAG: 4-hydroxy-3-methylbut-2-enyl diphosphate reductase [Porphyromonadaceae bacterium]
MSLKLKVEIDPRSGFCFGVVKAINRAEEILKNEGKLYCLGQIVHNDEEVKRLQQLGMITLTHDEIANIHGQKVLIRAHGEPPETYESLRKNGNEILDATCPIVLKLQDRMKKSEGDGEFILIYGKANHPEVVGLMGHLEGKGVVFKDIEELNLDELPEKVTLYSQTTMSVEKLYTVREKLEEAGIHVILKDTVCRQVSGRKEQMQEFCRKHDVIIFISGVESSNGKVLYDACREVNPRSHKISAVDEIDPSWFLNDNTVGICGATSTPSWQMEEAKEKTVRL